MPNVEKRDREDGQLVCKSSLCGLQGGDSDLGWVDFYCGVILAYGLLLPSRMVEHPKTQLAKPGCMSGTATL